MHKLVVDFNVLASGLVRGLAVDIEGGGDLPEGSLVLLTDGEGNEAVGILREMRDGLVFAEVDWETFGPEGRFHIVAIQAPEAPQETMYTTTGDVWRPAGPGSGVTPKLSAAEGAAVLA